MKHNIEKLINTDITLNHDNHEYNLSSNPEIDFMSCTELIGSHFRPFEAERIAGFLVYKTRKYSHYTVDSLLAEWREARDRGLRVHDQIDNNIKYGSSVNDSMAKQGVEWINTLANQYGDTIYSEVIVYSKELQLAGSIDLLIYNSKTNKCYLFDWKTSKKMDMKSSKKGITSATSDLSDCRFDKYSLQGNLYSYLLEKYHGIKIEESYLLHLSSYDVDTLKTSNLKSNINHIVASHAYSRSA